MNKDDRPYLVSLGYPSQNAPGGYSHFCGATLIDRRVVLTAAREYKIYFYALLPYLCSPFTKILLNSNTDCLTDANGNLFIIEGDSVNINKFDFWIAMKMLLRFYYVQMSLVMDVTQQLHMSSLIQSMTLPQVSMKRYFHILIV